MDIISNITTIKQELRQNFQTLEEKLTHITTNFTKM